jgi:hypothetical protein
MTYSISESITSSTASSSERVRSLSFPAIDLPTYYERAILLNMD